MVETARLFMIGRSQMVKLPKAFQFAGEDEVSISREGNRVVLEARPSAWSEGFARLAGSAVEFPYPEDPQAVTPNAALLLGEGGD